ncbi:phage head completion protein [Clostridium frigidicarnis]|uniref:Phage head-tail joining protein n=1 Tax=Clostridium frigidicarnis TaxID=84698 RepID=A0A1I0V1M3_9CLOT|nr:hypothetical protein [Clostridium frigidicarnis]SFA70191.1 hypothetical protein SAMN04488528_100193 [Clostridium frigidicarnis]
MANRSLTNDLNNRAELWGMGDGKDDWGEIGREPVRLKGLIYCNIVPSGYSNKENPVTSKYEHTHKFKVRYLSIKNPSRDMFFIHDKLKYEFEAWDKDFKHREYYNIFTKLIIE